TKFALGTTLRHNQTRSCGCLYRESRGEPKTHGLSRTPEHVIWCGMLGRCRTPTNTLFPKYGAKGVTVCERWAESFDAFLADMGPRPTPEPSVDRVDRARGYEPGNCRWATRREQAQNRSIVRVVTHNSETLPLIEWARRAGVGYTTLRARLSRGRPF